MSNHHRGRASDAARHEIVKKGNVVVVVIVVVAFNGGRRRRIGVVLFIGYQYRQCFFSFFGLGVLGKIGQKRQRRRWSNELLLLLLRKQGGVIRRIEPSGILPTRYRRQQQ